MVVDVKSSFLSDDLITGDKEKKKLYGVRIPGDMSYDYLRREIILGTISVNTIVRIAFIHYLNIYKPLLDSTNFCDVTGNYNDDDDDDDDDDDEDDFDDSEFEPDNLNAAALPANMNMTLNFGGNPSSQMFTSMPLFSLNSNDNDLMDEMGSKSLTILHFAMLLDDDALSEYLLDNEVDLMNTTDDCGPIIFLAIAKKKLDYVKRILDSGFLIDYRAPAPELSLLSSYSVLEVAVRSNDYKIIEFLISQGAEVNVSESNGMVSPLLIAARRGNVKMMKFLIDHGAVVNEEVLKIACQCNMSLKVIKFLLYNPAVKLTSEGNNENPNKSSPSNPGEFHENSILAWPLTHGHKHIITCLLNAGIDVNVANVYGKMIYEAPGLNKGCVEMIKKHLIKLIIAGFEVCDRNRKNVGTGEYAVFFAKCQNEVDVMKIIPVNGTDLTCYDLLRKEEEELTVCLKHFKNCIVLENYLTKIFPLYGGMLASRLKRCINQAS